MTTPSNPRPITPNIVSDAEGREIISQISFARTDGSTAHLPVTRDMQHWLDTVVQRRLARKDEQLARIIEQLEKLAIRAAGELE